MSIARPRAMPKTPIYAKGDSSHALNDVGVVGLERARLQGVLQEPYGQLVSNAPFPAA
jgi:hypothetical protein